MRKLDAGAECFLLLGVFKTQLRVLSWFRTYLQIKIANQKFRTKICKIAIQIFANQDKAMMQPKSKIFESGYF